MSPHRQNLPCRRSGDVNGVFAVTDDDIARIAAIIAEDQFQDRRFPGARRSGERDALSGLNGEADVAAVISIDDYDKLRRLKVEEFLALCERVGAQAEARGLSEEKLAELTRTF